MPAADRRTGTDRTGTAGTGAGAGGGEWGADGIGAADRPRLRPQFTIVAHDPGIVELREGVWNATSITLTDEGGGDALLAVVEGLDGAATVTEVAASARVPVADVLAVCERLRSAGALELGPTSALDHYVGQLMLTPSASANGSRDRVRRAVVLGEGEIAGQVHDHLRASLDVDAHRFADPLLWRRLCHDDLTRRDGDGLDAERLTDEFASFGGAFLVAALDAVNPILLRNLNRIAAGLGTPWVHAAPDGPFLIVGPTVVPGGSPCYECFERRVALNMRENAGYVRYKRALATGKARLGRTLLPSPVLSMVASLVSLEAVNHVVTGSTFTIGKALTVYLPTMEFCYHDVLRLPSCRVCVPRRERFQRQLHFDVRSYLNDVVLPKARPDAATPAPTNGSGPPPPADADADPGAGAG